MLFSSTLFIFIFLPIFFLCFVLSKSDYRNIILLAGSLAFYFWGEPIFCLIAIASAIFDHLLCLRIHRVGALKPSAKRYLTAGIICNLGLLLYFKYTNFFIASFSTLIYSQADHFNLLDILLPIGISFIVFEKITYLVDVYRGIGSPADSLLKYLNYIFLFPKLLAGPIIKYHEIEHQLNKRCINYDDMINGFKRFLIGLAKKVFIADGCSTIATQAFNLNQAELGFTYAWLGIICFTLQIYFDFSGYSDMALGLARMMGFNLKENFNMPYIATSFTDFWRRWHISLSTWIREYLYIPLGGSRVSQMRLYFNLWLCFLLSGLWHGANMTFVIWGAYNGIFLIVDKLIWLKASLSLPKVVRCSLTMLFIMLGWVIFRSSDFNQIQYYLAALIHPAIDNHAYMDVTSDIIAIILIGSMISFIPLLPAYARIQAAYQQWAMRASFENTAVSLLGFIAICRVVGASYTPFLYFKF